MDKQMMKSKLGRKYISDKRDAKFLIVDILPEKLQARTSRYWNATGWWGDQKETSQCVGYAWAHWIEDGPVTQPGKSPIVPPAEIYGEAQKIDEWVGEDYDGTSVRAGAKYLQRKGFISTYRWTFDIDVLIDTVLNLGPVVVGTNWYESMFYPSSDGMIYVQGDVVGGHAYVINGINVKKKQFRIKNSWGKSWGKSGHAYISFDDMARLIREDGEACLALEIKSGTNLSNALSKLKEKAINLSKETVDAVTNGLKLRELLSKK